MVRNAAVLRRVWRETSLAHLWSGTADWWTAAIVAVSEALAVRTTDARAASERLGRERADAGVFLDEARADVRVATELAALSPAYAGDVVDALTVGWIHSTLDGMLAMPCVDPLTDLVPVSYLATRLEEIRAEARVTGTNARDTHTLVMVKAPEARHPLEREAQMVTVGAALRSAFRGGETLARLTPSCAAALTQRSLVRLRESLAVLAGELSIATSDARLGQTRTWLEPVPSDTSGLAALLVELS
jgi:hypothetical protein